MLLQSSPWRRVSAVDRLREGRLPDAAALTVARVARRQRARRGPVAELAFEAAEDRSALDRQMSTETRLGGGRDVGMAARNSGRDAALLVETEGDSELVVSQLERELTRASADAGAVLAKKGSSVAAQSQRNRNGHIFPVERALHVHFLSRFCDALEGIAFFAFQGFSKPVNYFTRGNFAPAEEFGPERVLSVKGELPECLNGELVRAGPNPRFEALSGYHWFDGDGMLHGLRIKDGKVTYVSRYVKTARLAQEEYWGGPKFDRLGDYFGWKGLVVVGLYNLRVKFGVLDTSNGCYQANTALTYHNGKLLTLNEADKPYVIRVLEDGDLETVARLDYDNKLNHAFTAHPKIDPYTGEMFTFGYRVNAPPYVTYRVISKDGEMGDPVPITVRAPIMMHDFAITENYAIFTDIPVFFNPEDMIKKNQFVFSFDETKPTRFGVLPRYAKNEAQIRWFDLSSCVIFHNANAWEEGDDVVLISCRSPYIDLGVTSTTAKATMETFDFELWEYRFNMKTGKAMERKLGDVQSDFPRINDEYVGRKTQFVYTSVFEYASRVIGVVKYDLTLEPKLGEAKPRVGGNIAGLFWHGHKRIGSEPVFVPKNRGRGGDEDDGYLLNFVFDETRSVSEMVVIDAKTMSPDPVAVVELPTRVPYAFHALFVPETELQLQRV